MTPDQHLALTVFAALSSGTIVALPYRPTFVEAVI
jgi:hypothetical protein